MAASGWPTEPNGIISVDASPSLLYNNLSTNGEWLAYAHKETVRLFKEAASDGKTDAACEKAPYTDPVSVTQVKWVQVEGTWFLFICSAQGFQIVDSTGKRSLQFFNMASAAAASDDTVGSCRGVTGVPGSPSVCVGCYNGQILVWALSGRSSFTQSQVLEGHADAIVSLGASADWMVSGDRGGTVCVWSATALTRHCAFEEGGGFPATSVGVKRGVAIAAFASGHVRLFDIAGKRLTTEIAAHARCITALDVHPTRNSFATVGEDAVMNVWALPDGEDKGSADVTLEICSPVPDRLLAGVAFLLSEDAVVAATYDTHSLPFWRRA
uniref:WD repeat-containing protein 54 beta-propeller domain-containing protein n=1 Tax=Bicosoecida sp. CB-2014 TaxID=1486930 RepID=A0A7S1G9Z0_9STRA|mmetsp:Transcript_24112/g.83722  ORF Transcript_24112/g.83722 Transcript_24112/m.83722 type:complete len:326 (+) Transcript_24112:184-1161(+)|eukprot:CAMPEP_0203812820 /NCGR_PEP_ID=MMETSP0115-20131106/4362_1 /ASSEMBLY_ACC=CAM_ASM_000227 /TAXON_ID=33651 /ORGANISM="Bicosoecid sp, Strain ms1" /LENGTH=325 /DNA_ID=CAMNT_0050721671 /DNA_START=103 /DNA_END=1080 /DNA_ORIENTATION=+